MGEINIKLNKYTLLILVVYCIPFAFLSMYVDLTKQSIVVYIVTILFVSFMAFLAKRKSSLIVLLGANSLSLIHSYVWVTYVTEFEERGYYFSPFMPETLVIVVTVLFVLLQLAVYVFTKPSRYQRKLIKD